jgi:ferritin
MNRASILEQNINTINNSGKKETTKLEEVFVLVKKFEDENPIEETFAKISLVLKDFTEDSPTFNLLRQYIHEYSDINFFIDSSKHLFVRNSTFDE